MKPINWESIITAKDKISQIFDCYQYQNKFLYQMLFKIMLIIVAFSVWPFLRQWFFPQFNLTSYFLIQTNLFITLPRTLWPLLIYLTAAFAVSQIYAQKHTGCLSPEIKILGYKLFVKATLSGLNGSLEELGYRGIYLYYYLFLITIVNYLFVWIYPYLFMVIVGFLGLMILILTERDTWIYHTKGISIAFAILFITAGIFWLITYKAITDNYLYYLINKILPIMQKIVQNKLILLIISVGVLFLHCLINIVMIRLGDPQKPIKKIWSCAINKKQNIILIILSFFSLYVVPRFVDTITRLPNVNAEPAIYIGAILWSTVTFSRTHVTTNVNIPESFLFGAYMVFVAFNYGLFYALIAHLLFNATVHIIMHYHPLKNAKV